MEGVRWLDRLLMDVRLFFWLSIWLFGGYISFVDWLLMSVYFDKPRLKGINASTGQAALICKDRKTAAGEIHKTANWSPGGGYSIYSWVGRCGAAPHTLTLFKTNIADFPTLFKTEFRFLIPCLRHLTRNHTLCKTIIDSETLSYLIHWQSQNYLQLDQQSNEELFTLSIRSLH